MKELIGQIRSLWGGFSRGQRAVVYGLGGLVLVGCLLATFVGSSAEYVPVATKLDSEGMMKVTGRLEEMSVPFRVIEQGTAVEIPSDRLGEVQTLFARDNVLPRDSRVGNEGLDNVDFTMTEEQIRRRAVHYHENELAKLIEGYDHVSFASVKITPAKRGVSKRSTRDAEAAVFLKPDPGAHVRPQTVDAIVAFVAGSVEGLHPKDVVVTDSAGMVLAGGELASGGSHRMANAEREKSMQLQAAAHAALFAAFGENKFTLSVNVDLDGTRKETRRKTPDADSRVAIKETIRSTENTRSSQARGAVSTAPTQTGAHSENPGASKTEDIEKEYLVGTTEEVVTTESGGVKRLTIGVTCDESLASYEEQITGHVQRAVGFDEARDSFSIGFVPFASPPEAPMAPEPGLIESPGFQHWVEVGLTALLGIGLLLFLARSAKRARGAVRGAIQNIEAETKRREALLAKDKKRELTDDIVELVDRDTDSVGKLLRGWLYEPAKV